jgi:hypothetical protein
MILGILHNGPMTAFELHTGSDGPHRHLCRDDIRRIAVGHLDFDDGRPAIDLGEADKHQVTKQAQAILGRINRNELWADIGGEHFDHFTKKPSFYGRLTNSDLGHKFMFKGRPHVFLGAKRRGRKCKLAAKDLTTGKVLGFTVAAVEDALGKGESRVGHKSKTACRMTNSVEGGRNS